MLERIRDRWPWFAAAVGLGVAGGVGVWLVTPNKYVAEAVVALDARKVQVITIDSVVSRLPQDSPVLRTELDLIASRSMAQKVARRLGLVSRATADGLSEPAPEDPAAKRSPEARAVDRLVNGLRVNNDGRSFTIFIYFEAADPVFARNAANAYAEAYLDHQIEVQTQATRSASDWLGRKVSELGVRLETSEKAVEEFRRTAGLLETNGATADAQKLAGVSAEFAAARSQRAGAEARLSAAKELTNHAAGMAAFNEVLASASIQALRMREAEIGREIGDIEASGAMLSTALPAQRVQLAALRRQIDGEVDRVVASLANEVDVAARKEKALDAEAARLAAVVAENSEARVELNRLEREASANRTIYESFLNRYKQTIEQEGLAAPDATLLSSAEVPMRPSTPKLVPLLAFGLAIGSAVGVGLVSMPRRREPELPTAPEAEADGAAGAAVAKNPWRRHIHQVAEPCA
ncbi:GumC family protein [Chenggangzhangella methanolivorans]|uniref:GumC family protein n=1 Tax=Chenggangzhangella methanolivorans TaxID=1437009 RepID=UPI0036195A17